METVRYKSEKIKSTTKEEKTARYFKVLLKLKELSISLIGVTVCQRYVIH